MKRILSMDMPSNRKWVSLALMSVIIPISLLATFRLTGILPEPPTPETITAKAVSWNMSRPTDILTIDQWVKNYFADGIASLSISVQPGGYIENKVNWPSDGDDDVVDLYIIATANVSDGFIYSLVVRFFDTDSLTDIVFQQHPSSMELCNVEIKKIHDLGAYTREAYFEAIAVNQPRDTLLSVIAYWVFFDKNNANHRTTVNLEVTYFDGAAYRKVIIPIVLGVLVG